MMLTKVQAIHPKKKPEEAWMMLLKDAKVASVLWKGHPGHGPMQLHGVRARV